MRLQLQNKPTSASTRSRLLRDDERVRRKQDIRLKTSIHPAADVPAPTKTGDYDEILPRRASSRNIHSTRDAFGV
jgi:hypothetical protein